MTLIYICIVLKTILSDILSDLNLPDDVMFNQNTPICCKWIYKAKFDMQGRLH